MSNELAQRVEDLQLLGWSEEGARRYFSDDLIQDNYLEMVLAKPELALGLIAVILLGVVCLVSAFNHLMLKKKEEGFSERESTPPIEEKPLSEKILIKQNIEVAKENIEVVKENIEVVKENIEVVKEVVFVYGNSIVSRLNNKKKRAPFFDYFNKLFRQTSIDTDILIVHFLLASLIIFESINYLFVFLIRDLPSFKILVSIKDLFKYPMESKKNRLKISEGILLEDRKKILMSKTNAELKNLLTGVGNTSRLKKSELVEKILSLEFNLKANSI